MKAKKKDCNVEFRWVHGFVEKFPCLPNEKSVKSWYNHGMGLDCIVRVIIKNGEGEVLYDVKKENPFTKKAEGNDGAEGTKEKTTVRKATRSRTKE